MTSAAMVPTKKSEGQHHPPDLVDIKTDIAIAKYEHASPRPLPKKSTKRVK